MCTKKPEVCVQTNTCISTRQVMYTIVNVTPRIKTGHIPYHKVGIWKKTLFKKTFPPVCTYTHFKCTAVTTYISIILHSFTQKKHPLLPCKLLRVKAVDIRANECVSMVWNNHTKSGLKQATFKEGYCLFKCLSAFGTLCFNATVLCKWNPNKLKLVGFLSVSALKRERMQPHY